MARTLKDLEQDIATLKEDVATIKLYYKIAWTVATALGFSVAVLAGWLTHERTKLSDLRVQIDRTNVQMGKVRDEVNADQNLIKSTAAQQLQIVRTSAQPIVRDLANENMAETEAKIERLQKDMTSLEEDTYFIMFADIVYPGGPGGYYHDKTANRESHFPERYGRTQAEIEAKLRAQGYPNHL